MSCSVAKHGMKSGTVLNIHKNIAESANTHTDIDTDKLGGGGLQTLRHTLLQSVKCFPFAKKLGAYQLLKLLGGVPTT